jgi:hypothetical protein
MRHVRLLATFLILAMCPAVRAQPVYTIIDLGLAPGGSGSQGLGVAPGGGFATGRTLLSSSHVAFSWTSAGGRTDLPNLASPSRPFGIGNGVNDAGVVVGTGATSFTGASPLPLIWQGGTVTQLPLPAGQTLGRAQAINATNVAVGSVNGGSAQRGAIFTAGGSSVITETTPGGSFLVSAFGINNAGRVVGSGIDPLNAARNVGFVLDTATSTAFEVPALPGFNGALNFGVSNAGHVTGSSMLNQGSGLPFVWSDAGGTVAIPLPAGTSQGSGRAVNALGMVVGTASSAFAIPFLYDGTTTHRLGDLIPAGSGWDLLTNTSSSALGISDTGVIVGTGVFNGVPHAYAMVPVPEPSALALAAAAATGLGVRRWRRRQK